ncbi:hypothetical protein NL676_019914 [Syzygium grande]|nr:hypothetical protein NL676_019914 [Syzygium grande]
MGGLGPGGETGWVGPADVAGPLSSALSVSRRRRATSVIPAWGRTRFRMGGPGPGARGGDGVGGARLTGPARLPAGGGAATGGAFRGDGVSRPFIMSVCFGPPKFSISSDLRWAAYFRAARGPLLGLLVSGDPPFRPGRARWARCCGPLQSALADESRARGVHWKRSRLGL